MIDKETAQKILDKYDRDYATFSEKATRKEFHTVLKYVADESNRRQRRQVGLDKQEPHKINRDYTINQHKRLKPFVLVFHYSETLKITCIYL